MTQENLTTSTISPTEFRAFIQTLWEHAPHIRIRVRPLGQMWQKNFSPIVHVTGSGAIIIQDGDEMKHLSVADIIQFEIEGQFQGIKPLSHYNIK